MQKDSNGSKAAGLTPPPLLEDNSTNHSSYWQNENLLYEIDIFLRKDDQDCDYGIRIMTPTDVYQDILTVKFVGLIITSVVKLKHFTIFLFKQKWEDIEEFNAQLAALAKL